MTRESDAGVIVGKIYDAALDGEQWSDLLCEVADFCGVENASLVIADPSINFSSVTTPRADPEVVNAYIEYWWQHDPTIAVAAQTPVGSFLTLDEAGREEFYSSAFYNDFWRFSGIGAERIATNLLLDNNSLSNIVLQSSARRDEVGEFAREGIEILAPHLMRAVNISRKFHQLDIERAGTLSFSIDDNKEGMIVVDARGCVLFADEKAEALFSQNAMLKLGNGCVQLSNTRANVELLSAIDACAQTEVNRPAGTKIKLQQVPGRPGLIIDILPYRTNMSNLFSKPAAAMLLVRRSNECREAKIEKYKQHFGLTPAEAALAYEVLKGDGRAAAAARCGITINTARTHLMRIFDKTNVRRQAELVRVLTDIDI